MSGGGISAHFRDSSKVRVDEASATVTYVGIATTGTATSTAAWKILRITTSGADLDLDWADGDTKPDNIWDNRASLSYG